MNGPHDVGGIMGFGPVKPEVDEPSFHAEWEKRVLGMTLCAGALGHWNLDESRHARENRHPADYYQSTYYEIWQKGLERLLLRHEVVTADELSTGISRQARPEAVRLLTADQVPATLRRGGPVSRPATSDARYAIGDQIKTKVMNPATHTRLPRYARGKVGVVEQAHGSHVYPDSNAHGHGEQPQWLYTIRFDGRELWGPDAEPGLHVSIDAWEPYLERA